MIPPAAFDRRAVLAGALAGATVIAPACYGRVADLPSLDVTRPPFDADPTGGRNSTDAFAAASRAICSAGGGTLVVPRGTYTVGRQRLAGRGGGDWAYEPDPVILLRDCPHPVTIAGEGARLRCEDGLRFGSFDPHSGQPIDPVLPFTEHDRRASPYVAMIGLYDNRAPVRISGLELDGNNRGLLLGGGWNDNGIQIPASGLEMYGNADVTIANVSSHNHGLDGVIVGYAGLREGEPDRPHRFVGCMFEENGRQGMSWVGGNRLDATRCRFGRSGRAGLISAPAAGLDIEAEQSVCRGGVFERCEFSDNAGVGMLAHGPSDNADISFRDCLFVGTTNWSAWPSSPAMRFDRCRFVGALTNPHGNRNPDLATQIHDSHLTADPAASPTGKVYVQNYLTMEISAAENVLLERCLIESGANTSRGLAYIDGGVILRDCRLNQSGPGLAVLRARFEGRNVLTTLGKAEFNGARFAVPLMLNGTAIAS